MPGYQIRLYDVSGNRLHVTERFRTAVVQHQVNLPSTLTLGLYELSPEAQFLENNLDAIIELRRWDATAQLNWYTEYVGFHRTNQLEWTTADNRIFTSYSRGLLDLIKRRSVRYFSDLNCGLPDPAPADDVIKALVLANAGSLALTTNGRATDGVTPGLSVQALTSLAPNYQGDHQGKNLLEAITDIGPPNKTDFDVIWGGPSSPTTFEFRTYYPHRGTDRRASSALPTVLAPNFGNLSNPSYTRSRTDEVTSAVVYGALGDVTLATASDISETPWNVYEADVDARGEDRAQALTNRANQMLFDKRAVTSLKFDVIQTPSSFYGKHYFLGDLITVRFSNVSGDVKIKGVTLSIDPGRGEQITIEPEEWVP